jgi:hypothetical protein
VIWLAWRQLRTQAAIVFGGLALLAVFVLYSGLRLRHFYATSGVKTCAKLGDCDVVVNAFTSRYGWQQTLLALLVLFLPAVTGVFWGAPLVAREFETGTFRLVWTQSVTRTRWLAAKVAVVGFASMAATALLTWMITWWFTPIDHHQRRFDQALFGERAIAPIGYAAFAFALGLVAGLLLRRMLPAMAVTLVGYIAARMVVVLWVRPHFSPAVHYLGSLQSDPAARNLGTFDQNGAWVIKSQVIDPAGHANSNIHINIADGDPCIAARSCMRGWHQSIYYQPANRYWPFQWDETLLFAGVAMLLVGFCFWWINGHPLRPSRSSRRAETATPTAVVTSIS